MKDRVNSQKHKLKIDIYIIYTIKQKLLALNNKYTTDEKLHSKDIFGMKPVLFKFQIL